MEYSNMGSPCNSIKLQSIPLEMSIESQEINVQSIPLEMSIESQEINVQSIPLEMSIESQEINVQSIPLEMSIESQEVCCSDNFPMLREEEQLQPIFRLPPEPKRVEMLIEGQQGYCSDNFPTLRDEQQEQQPPPSIFGFPLEPERAMNAEFYKCLRAGKADALNLMVEDGLLNQVTPQQNTALHIVARQGFHQLIEPILSRRQDLLYEQNINGDLALHLAAGAGHLGAVTSIMEFVGQKDGESLCEVVNRDGETALHVAVTHKHTRVAMSLIDYYPKASFCLNTRQESPLFVAAELGELELVKAMIQASVADDVQRHGKSVVYAAILGGNSGVLEAILSKYEFLVDSTISLMNNARISPLSYAAMKGNIQMVRYILHKFPERAYKRDPWGTYPIHIAAGAGHISAVEELLGLHPDSRELYTTSGQNILHIAASRGKDNVVSYLLSKPDFEDLINARDVKGNTPLHNAVAAKYPKVVDALTWDKRVKLDLVDSHGQTAMDVALQYENSVPSLKEQLTWLALRYAGAPRKNIQEAKKSNESEQEIINTYKDRVNTLAVVATLVTTMSFAAGITFPGGNSGSDKDLGMANFRKRGIFQLFVISNSIALYTSVIDVLVLIFSMSGDAKVLRISLKVAGPLLAISLATMSISFMSAAYLTVSGLRGLGIVIWVLGSVFLAAVMALFLLIFPPLSARNWFTRYLAYLPFRALLYISERK